MSGQVVSILPIPRETARSAKATLSHNNFYIQTGEHLEAIWEAIQPKRLLEIGIILPQITLFQLLEGLTDTQATDAVRFRLDWKYALHLPFYSPTFRENELCQFRQTALTDIACQQEIDLFIDHITLFNHPQIDKLRNLKNPEILKVVCSMNRLGLAHESMNRAIETMVFKYPEWLRTIALPHWYGRYNHSMPSLNLPATLEQQETLIHEIFKDIHYILDEMHRSGIVEMDELQGLDTLDKNWILHLEANTSEKTNGQHVNIHYCDFCPYKAKTKSDNRYL